MGQFYPNFCSNIKYNRHIFGYFVFILLGGIQWKYGFLLESISISSLFFILILIPFKYYDKNYINPDNVEINI